MYMKRYAMLLPGLFFAMALAAQTTPTLPIFCGNEVFHHIVKKQYPAWQESIERTFSETQAQPKGAADRSEMTINVVVHVVWKNAAENLHDSVILNQIAILNRDFNRQNPDSVNLRSIFHPVAGNPQIKFNLTEIVRRQTTAAFSLDLLGSSLLSELKHQNEGGSDAWDTEKYLNIWVCKIQPTTIFGVPVGQILGFAFPPDGLDNWPSGSSAPAPDEDGVVIDFRVFGSNNPNTIEMPGGTGNLDVRGRTPVHEVGHYLGLRHIWGDGGLLGPNDCDQTDGIDDTPFASAQSEFNCDTTKNTCEVVEIYYTMDMPDLVENYMDYSSESCMNMFTKGQSVHMRNTLAGPRKGLVEGSSNTYLPANTLGFAVSPNPATESIRVQLDNPRDTEIALFAADGRLVLQQQATGSYFDIPLTGITPGVYALRLRAGGEYGVQRVVVK